MRLFSTPKSNRPGILDTLSKDGYNFAATLKNVAHDTMSMLSYDDEVVNDEVKGGKLGTIPGVLLPCLQNILESFGNTGERNYSLVKNNFHNVSIIISRWS